MKKHNSWIAGVDEVGRGPLAGPVVVAAVILDPEQPIEGLMDSKALSPKRRHILAETIRLKAKAFAIGRAEVEEIDRYNILQATLLAMQRAVLALPIIPDLVQIDGNKAPNLPYPTETIIRGDQLIEAISAASILAKVTRDEEMDHWDRLYPGYGFAQHKGYGTALHLAALARQGPCVIHRASFAPVRQAILRQKEAVL